MNHTNTDTDTIRDGIGKGRIRRIFFLGAGGSGMSALAALTADRGFIVSGCDAHDGEGVEALRRAGCSVRVPEPRTLPDGVDLCVCSLALPDAHPLLAAAREHGIPVLSRAQWLGVISERYPVRIGVSGTHGKSTVTAMLSEIFLAVGRAPTVLCGADLRRGRCGYLPGGDGVLIYEACEYKKSFLYFHPTLSVFLNLEEDHPDTYPTVAELKAAFRTAAERTRGEVLYTRGSPLLAEAMDSIATSARTFGEEGNGAFFGWRTGEGTPGGGSFSFFEDGACLGEVHLRVPGAFQTANAAAAIGAARMAGVSFDAAAEGIARFGGIGRRMERIGTLQGRALYYDYAHHPTEIRAVLTTLAGMYKSVSAVFVPHTYSRTAALLDDFADSLKIANKVYILPIFAAREAPIPGICAQTLAQKIPGALTGSPREIYSRMLSDGTDAAVLLGAGDMSEMLSLCRGADTDGESFSREKEKT